MLMSLDVEALYTTHGPMVLRRCKRLLDDEEAAVDAMQEVFVRALERADQLDAHAPSSLLYTMATRVCLNRIRTQRRRPESPDSDLIAALADLTRHEQQHEARSLLDRLFRRQPESSATIAALYWLDGLTHEQVAARVDMSVSGVRKRLRNLQDDLGQLVAQRSPAP
jgi:RNA polymerase sigma factor (sigma-70 family)